jgi:hypothetical protein
MKHCLPDPKASEEFGGYLTVFSCEFDDGKRSSGQGTILRIGEDGKIMLFLCHSCLDQLRGQILSDVLHPIIMNAIRQDKELLQELFHASLKKITEEKHE